MAVADEPEATPSEHGALEELHAGLPEADERYVHEASAELRALGLVEGVWAEEGEVRGYAYRLGTTAIARLDLARLPVMGVLPTDEPPAIEMWASALTEPLRERLLALAKESEGKPIELAIRTERDVAHFVALARARRDLVESHAGERI